MIEINTGLQINTALSVDSRFVLSKEQMLNANPNIIPDVYFCVCSDDGQFYLYNKDNAGNAETGKYEKLTGGVDDTEIWKESTEYIAGKIVKYNGKKYQCITLHTSSSVFEDDGANWIELVETYALLTKAQHDYLVENNLIEDKIYVKVDDVTSEDNLVNLDGITIKEFDVTVEYQVGEYVIYDNVIYKANTTTTIGSFIESEWDKIGDDLTLVDKVTLEGMLGLTEEELETLSTIILDTEVRLDKTYSSSKIYGSIQTALADAKTFTLQEIGKMAGVSYHVVASTDEMTDTRIIYLLPNATNYDLYIVEDDGSTTRIGDMDIDLNGYLETSDIVTVLDETVTNDQVVGAKVIYDELQTMRTNFQDGVDTLYDTCVDCGATPTDKTPTAITEAIKLLAQSNIWWKDWLDLGGISTATYNSLDDVLDDTNALEILMRKHDSVDYLIDKLSSNAVALDIIVNDENAMTYIGTYDYCSDRMLADSILSTALLSSTYWQCILKDHVPTMTNATSPSGEVLVSSSLDGYEAYNAFDKNDNTIWASIINSTSTPTEYLGYRFDNPNCVRKIYFKNRTNSAVEGVKSPINIIVQASNDGSNWIDLLSYTNNNTTSACETYIDIENSNYYLHYRLYIAGVLYNERNICLAELDFFGRSLNVSVPTMTSNTSSDGGEAFASSIYASSMDAYKSFDGNTTNTGNVWASAQSATITATTPQWIGYDFKKDICCKYVEYYLRCTSDTNPPATFTIEGSNDRVTWETIYTGVNTIATAKSVIRCELDNEKNYQQYRFKVTSIIKNQPYSAVVCQELKFYGVDYSE